MEAAWKKYVRAFRKELDAWAVWQPGTPVELCDYGVVEGGRWSKLGSLWEILPRGEEDTSEESEAAEFTFGSAYVSDIETHADAPGGLASVTVRFGTRDSLYVRASKSVFSRVANLQNLSHRVIAAKDKWERNWYLVTGIRSATKFTVLSASEPNSEVKVSATVPDIQSFLMGSISANAGVSFTGNVSFSFIGRLGPIHIDLVRLRVRWWSGVDSYRPVRVARLMVMFGFLMRRDLLDIVALVLAEWARKP